MEDQTKITLLIGIVVVTIALLIVSTYNMLSYDEDNNSVNHHTSNCYKHKKEIFASNEFDDTEDDTTISYNNGKITIETHDFTITADAVYDDSSELSEADVQRIANQLIQHAHITKHKKPTYNTYFVSGYGEVEDVYNLGGFCGFYKTACCGETYACPNGRRGGYVTVGGSNPFNNSRNPSMKMGGTPSELSSYPSFSF